MDNIKRYNIMVSVPTYLKEQHGPIVEQNARYRAAQELYKLLVPDTHYSVMVREKLEHENWENEVFTISFDLRITERREWVIMPFPRFEDMEVFDVARSAVQELKYRVRKWIGRFLPSFVIRNRVK